MREFAILIKGKVSTFLKLVDAAILMSLLRQTEVAMKSQSVFNESFRQVRCKGDVST